jgi:hypothetical protein
MEYTFYRFKSKNIEIREFYIGSTEDFNARKIKHKSDCNNEDSPAYNYKVYQFIRSNGGCDEWEFEIIDKIVCCELDRFLHEEKLTDLYGATLNSRRSIIPTEERIEYLKEYHKEYYQNNKEKKNKQNKEWCDNNKEKRKEIDKKYRENNKEKTNEIHKKWCDNNKEKKKEIDKRYRLKKKLATSI